MNYDNYLKSNKSLNIHDIDNIIHIDDFELDEDSLHVFHLKEEIKENKLLDNCVKLIPEGYVIFDEPIYSTNRTLLIKFVKKNRAYDDFIAHIKELYNIK